MKDIKGFEGLYAVTEDGKVWSYRNNKYLAIRGSGKDKKGIERKYKTICFSKNKKRFYKYIHRLVAETYIPNPKNMPEVNHIDANPSNNKVSNLEWCTSKQNGVHMSKIGNSTRGETNARAKLKEYQVKEILCLLTMPISKRKIAKAYNVSASTIDLISWNKNWYWVTPSHTHKQVV